jgi:site-specific recombinase XerD
VALTLQDLDLEAAVITIRDTKFHKTRLVPVELKLNQTMTQYATQRKEAGHSQSSDAPFFVLRRGAPLSVHIVREAFSRLRKCAVVGRPDGARYQPRLHDMRHSFCCPETDVLYEQGADVTRNSYLNWQLSWAHEYRCNRTVAPLGAAALSQACPTASSKRLLNGLCSATAALSRS